jgi:hypothetical protein
VDMIFRHNGADLPRMIEETSAESDPAPGSLPVKRLEALVQRP